MSTVFPFTTLPHNQHTLAAPLVCAGIGLHSGANASLSVHPAPANSGLVIIRTDVADESGRLELRADAVVQTIRGTNLGNAAGTMIATTEHVLAALYACGVDNAVLNIDGPEMPAMDGSALAFAEAISKSGLKEQRAQRHYIEVLKPLQISDGTRQVSLAPRQNLMISARIDYPATLIGVQNFQCEITAANFVADIAPARTFVLEQEVADLRDAGLARGGSHDNCLVIDGMALQNKDGLRFKDEFARHKVLDILGDIALAGAPILGHFTSDCAGHALNNALIRALMADASAWRKTTLPLAK